MKTKIEMAIWRLLQVFSFTYANEKSNETILETEPLRTAKTMKNWTAKHGMSSKQYQDNFTKLSKKGFRLTAVDCCFFNSTGNGNGHSATLVTAILF